MCLAVVAKLPVDSHCAERLNRVKQGTYHRNMCYPYGHQPIGRLLFIRDVMLRVCMHDHTLYIGQ